MTEEYLDACMEVIKFELKIQRKSKGWFYKEMSTRTLWYENDKTPVTFCGSTKTVERYLNRKVDAGKDHHMFMLASGRVLGLYEWELIEMIDIYLSKAGKTINEEMYKKSIHDPACAYRPVANRLANSLRNSMFTEGDKNSALLNCLDEVIKQSSRKEDLKNTIALYNVLMDFTPKMQWFWLKCMAEFYDNDKAYFTKINKKISKIKVTLNTTNDFRLLLKIKSDDIKQWNHLTIEQYKKNRETVKVKFFLCAFIFCGLKEKEKELFLEIAIKYTFLKKTKGVLELE